MIFRFNIDILEALEIKPTSFLTENSEQIKYLM